MKTVFAKEVTRKDKFLIIPVFEKDESIKKYKNFKAKHGETLYIHGHDQEILMLGLGELEKFDAKRIREAMAEATKEATCRKAAIISLKLIPELSKYGQEIGEGIGLANYTFAKYKTGKEAKELAEKQIKHIRIIAPKFNGFQQGIQKGFEIAETVNYTRDLVTGPANIITVDYLANEAKRVARQNGYKVIILNRKQIEKLKMGGILAVNSGSSHNHQEAKLAILEYRGGTRSEKPIVMVGKGLIFDSGGYNLKPNPAIFNMQQDMAGGATILGIFSLLKKLKIKKNVIGLIPITENMIDSDAFRPNDILTMYNGKTVEILNTDAEGRLILADALAYASKKYNPEYLIDIATLTGACIVALGDRYTGLFTNDKELTEKLIEAGKSTDDLVWHMPIHEDHEKIMESKIADLRNVEEGYNAAACTAAAFLKNFVSDRKWAHLDIAGTAFTKNPKKYETEKGTGSTVRLLIKFLES